MASPEGRVANFVGTIARKVGRAEKYACNDGPVFSQAESDASFQPYQERGLTRSDFIVSKEARDADPLSCHPDIERGSEFLTDDGMHTNDAGNIENFVYLDRASSGAEGYTFYSYPSGPISMSTPYSNSSDIASVHTVGTKITLRKHQSSILLDKNFLFIESHLLVLDPDVEHAINVVLQPSPGRRRSDFSPPVNREGSTLAGKLIVGAGTMPLIKPEQPQNDAVDTLQPLKRRILAYLRRFLSVVTDAAVLMGITIAGYGAILYACKALWRLYLSTQVGKQFLLYFPHAAQSTTDLFEMDLLSLSIQISIYAFVICIAIGSTFRFLYVARYVPGQFGILGRIAVCGLPLAALIATYVQPVYGIPEWSTAFMVVLIPTLSVFSRCFSYTEKLLPEAGEMKKLFTR